jgi:hypothetical protein
MTFLTLEATSKYDQRWIIYVLRKASHGGFGIATLSILSGGYMLPPKIEMPRARKALDLAASKI